MNECLTTPQHEKQIGYWVSTVCVTSEGFFCSTTLVNIAGMLLRFFMAYYDLEILDEESFLKWKEEVNDEYPGKGKSLFQVKAVLGLKIVFHGFFLI